MDILDYAIKRSKAFKVIADRICESEFPHAQSQIAAKKIRDYARHDLIEIEKHDPQRTNKDVYKISCENSLTNLVDYIRLLGIILRSTNVRIAFETFGPLQWLAYELLKRSDNPNGHTNSDSQIPMLLLSSEWEYSPFIQTEEQHGLSGFIMIGLPASESDNPLLIPLSGHELGHAVWHKYELHNTFLPKILSNMINIVNTENPKYEKLFTIFTTNELDNFLGDSTLKGYYNTWAYKWAVNQAEEIFADYIGILIFGLSYLHAFAYLLSPRITELSRKYNYPSMVQRVKYISSVAKKLKIAIPKNYEDMFEEPGDANSYLEIEKLHLELTDSTVTSINEDIYKEAFHIINTQLPYTWSNVEELRIINKYAYKIPAEGCNSMADIINAGWNCYQNEKFWEQENEDNKERILKDLILKNMEIFDIERRRQFYNDAQRKRN